MKGGVADALHSLALMPPRIDDLLDDQGSRYFIPKDDKPAARPPGGARLRGRGPRFSTMLKDWNATRDPDAFSRRLEKRLRKAGLIRPRRPSLDEEAAIDLIMGIGGIDDAPLA